MNKNPEHLHDLELLKAVAQAIYSRSGNSKPISEFDAHRRYFECKPSRFHPKSHVMNTSSLAMEVSSVASPTWDFNQSLWDSYELVSVSRRLETGLGLDSDNDPFSVSSLSRFLRRRRKESKNSLRNLFNQMSSRRFNHSQVPHPK